MSSTLPPGGPIDGPTTNPGPVPPPLAGLPSGLPAWVYALGLLLTSGGALGGGSYFGSQAAVEMAGRDIEELQATVKELDDKVDRLLIAFARAHPTAAPQPVSP